MALRSKRSSASGLTFGAVAKDFARDPSAYGQRHVLAYECEHLQRFFCRQRVAAIQPRHVVDYQQKRLAEQASIRTINWELRTLGWICRGLMSQGRLRKMPLIGFLDETTSQCSTVEIGPISRHLIATAVPAPHPVGRRRRGTLSDGDLGKHLDAHPLGKLTANGSPFSVNQRLKELKKDDIVISRSQLTRRLNARRNTAK